jgi:putative thioredoxin
VLERLAAEANGDFVLAKVNVDENPGLAMRYGVQGIPAVKAFVDGRVVDEFVGALPEPQVREFLRRVVPSEADRQVRQAQRLLAAGGLEEAESLLRRVLEREPDHPRALLTLGRVLMEQDRPDEALKVLERIPWHLPEHREAKELMAMLDLRREAQACGGLEACREKLAADPDDLEARYGLAMALAAEGHYEDALRHLLAIVSRDRRFRDDGARKAMVAIFEILGEEHPLVREYREKLAMAIF